MRDFRRIIISRTDSIGDVVLTLPLAGILKKKFPESSIIFLGKSYTRAVINACTEVDEFLNWDEISEADEDQAILMLKEANADLIIHVFPRKEIARLAKKAGIPYRLGTTNRLYHWGTCNKLVRLSRRKSDLHEAQLNCNLAKGISGEGSLTLDELFELGKLSNTEVLDEKFQKLIDPDRFNLILHPKSKGSAREWGLDNFRRLIEILPSEEYKIFISGTEDEGSLIKGSGILDLPGVTDLTGQMSLAQLMSFIKACDGLVAASTGPLHLAAALGIRAIGIYPPIRPMHPGRWAPIGRNATYLVKDIECEDCRKGNSCHCMAEIQPEQVKQLLKKTNK